ncbi:flavin reductase family protein [Micromonospora andamanensis]|uniref:flavin reductase family protein n=1 Tax=Micromonospora andamanensis TaxID=1287068 RepID=UPI00194DD26D|nr:flavin reductase family protein [Micromonospora andamanensis]GIJ37246.1 oxidoreductase [Micromonospora andamanensis]
MSTAATRDAAATGRDEAAAPAAVTIQALREAFAHLPAAVTVVTTLTPDGPAGMTASAVSSLSLDPPLLLICAANTSGTLARLRAHGRFAVNTLPAGHRTLAHTFANPEPHPGHRFTCVPYRIVDAVPVLSDALTVFTCAVEQTHPGGDHTIVVGRITAVSHHPGQPLLWHARSYRRLAPAAGDHLSDQPRRS